MQVILSSAHVCWHAGVKDTAGTQPEPAQLSPAAAPLAQAATLIESAPAAQKAGATVDASANGTEPAPKAAAPDAAEGDEGAEMEVVSHLSAVVCSCASASLNRNLEGE